MRQICNCPSRNDECLNQANDGRTFPPLNVICWEHWLGQVTSAGFLDNQKLLAHVPPLWKTIVNHPASSSSLWSASNPSLFLNLTLKVTNDCRLTRAFLKSPLSQLEAFNINKKRPIHQKASGFTLAHIQRSEERRVGKECRSRWSPYH